MYSERFIPVSFLKLVESLLRPINIVFAMSSVLNGSDKGSRAVRWDSYNVLKLNDDVREVADELVKCNGLQKTMDYK